MKENKNIVLMCPKYYEIVNHEFDEKDVVGKKLIQIFQEYTFTGEANDKDFVIKINKLSDTIDRYFDDLEFQKEIVNVMSSLKVKKDTENIFEVITNEIIKTYDKYLEYYTRNLYIPRWI